MCPAVRPPNQGTPLLRSQGGRPEWAGDLELWIEDHEWEKLLLPQPLWPLEEEKRETRKVERGCPMGGREAVYAWRQWVIFVFIDEWADLGNYNNYNNSVLLTSPWKSLPFINRAFQHVSSYWSPRLPVLICPLSLYALISPGILIYRLLFLCILDVLLKRWVRGSECRPSMSRALDLILSTSE